MVVEPAAMAETTPELLTVAAAPLVLDHVPPEAASVSDMVEPVQVLDEPDMLPAFGDTPVVTA